MQMSAAIVIAFSAMARASRSVLCASAFAAASANGPPDPIATIPSSGSIRSPLPESRNIALASSTTSIASSRRRIRTLRQSFAMPPTGVALTALVPMFLLAVPASAQETARGSYGPGAGGGGGSTSGGGSSSAGGSSGGGGSVSSGGSSGGGSSSMSSGGSGSSGSG